MDGVPTRYQEAIIDRLRQAQGYATPVAFGDMSSIFTKEVTPALTGERPVKDALDAVKVQWDRLLKDFPSA
jgi:ABC-type glycerol-3-phosphate transport system substrate-binding protein